MRLINADALYEQLKQDEEMARNRVLDTESSLPFPNNLNPSYTRYVAQMDERIRLKHMVADAPTIEERKKGRWMFYDSESDIYNDIGCPFCKKTFTVDAYRRDDIGFTVDDLRFCPNCGAKMEVES